MIKDDVKLGKNVIIHHPDQVNIYGCAIGDGTSIGSFVEIKSSVVIGRNCKIQAMVYIPEGVTIGDRVFIGPNVTFTNDRKPRATNPDGTRKDACDWKMDRTVVGDGASIGAGATILPGITIGKNALVGAGAVVTRDVPDGWTVVGNPAKKLEK